MFDGLSLNPFALFYDGFGLAEVGVGRGHIAQALVVVVMDVVLDKGPDLALEVAGQEVAFQQDAVFPVSTYGADLRL